MVHIVRIDRIAGNSPHSRGHIVPLCGEAFYQRTRLIQQLDRERAVRSGRHRQEVSAEQQSLRRESEGLGISAVDIIKIGAAAIGDSYVRKSDFVQHLRRLVRGRHTAEVCRHQVVDGAFHSCQRDLRVGQVAQHQLYVFDIPAAYRYGNVFQVSIGSGHAAGKFHLDGSRILPLIGEGLPSGKQFCLGHRRSGSQYGLGVSERAAPGTERRCPAVCVQRQRIGLAGLVVQPYTQQSALLAGAERRRSFELIQFLLHNPFCIVCRILRIPIQILMADIRGPVAGSFIEDGVHLADVVQVIRTGQCSPRPCRGPYPQDDVPFGILPLGGEMLFRAAGTYCGKKRKAQGYVLYSLHCVSVWDNFLNIALGISRDIPKA